MPATLGDERDCPTQADEWRRNSRPDREPSIDRLVCSGCHPIRLRFNLSGSVVQGRARAIRRTTQPATQGLLFVGWTRLSTATEPIQALSVLGDRFDIQLAVEISGLHPADLLRALDIAQGQGLLVVEDGFVRFTSEGLEQAQRELGSHGRAQAHAHAAEVLERVRPRDLAGIAEQRAGAVAVLGLEPALAALDVPPTPLNEPSTGRVRLGYGSAPTGSQQGSTTTGPGSWRFGGHDASIAPGSSPRR